MIIEKLYVPEDAAFYDLDAQGNFVRLRSDVISRVCGEHVIDHDTFDHIWERQLHNAKAFWAPYPLPSIALDDPAFVHPAPRNSWGGPSQALTALRAPRWFEFYGKPAELGFLMDRWCEAIQRDPTFRQQIDPMTGDFNQGDLPAYSPAALAMIDFTWRLAGPSEEEDTLEWNLRPKHTVAADGARFALSFDRGRTAAITYRKQSAALHLDGRSLGHMNAGSARLITDKQGRPKQLVGISETPESISIALPPHPTQHFTLDLNQVLQLS